MELLGLLGNRDATVVVGFALVALWVWEVTLNDHFRVVWPWLLLAPATTHVHDGLKRILTGDEGGFLFGRTLCWVSLLALVPYVIWTIDRELRRRLHIR